MRDAERDPRSHRRYRENRAAWIPAHLGDDCALCGWPVTYLPTVEHTVPVRVIVRQARTYQEAVAMCCDTAHWAIAHTRCQNQQGAEVTNGRGRVVSQSASRDW